MELTHLARPIDPRYPSNRVIVVAGLVAAGAGFARWNDGRLWPTIVTALSVGALVVVTWALARELDPDHPTAATVAAVGTLGLALAIQPIAVLPAAGLMVAGRVLLRSTGKPPTAVDLLALMAGSWLLGRSGAGWITALVLAFAIARDRTLPGEAASRLARIAAPFSIAVIASVSVAFASNEQWIRPEWWQILLGGAGLAAAAMTRPYPPASPCDLRGLPLEPRRLQSARRVVAAGAILASALGTIGLVPMLPVWLAFVAVYLRQLGVVPELHPVATSGQAETP